MNLIDIYISEVGKHLPKKSRTDIQEEIRSALQDLLDDRSQQSGRAIDEELIIKVLKEYGSPEKVAASYLPERYLIGPQLFPAFLKTIQIVLPIVGALALVGLGISLGKVNLSLENWFETTVQAVVEFFNSAIIALGNIVLIFAILERAIPNLKEKTKTWDPRSLEKISPPDQVSLVEPVVAILFNFAAIVIFNFYPQLLGASYVEGQGWTFTQVLSEAFFRYVPVLTLLWGLKIILNILLLRRGQWQTWMRWFSLGLQAIEVGIASAMLKGPSLIALTAQDLTSKWLIPSSPAQTLVELLNQAVTWALIIAIAAGIVEIIKIVLRLLKSKTPTVLIRGK
jgi:hypothetical protein